LIISAKKKNIRIYVPDVVKVGGGGLDMGGG
jgi:hypothetical protein